MRIGLQQGNNSAVLFVRDSDMSRFNWHADHIDGSTPVTEGYRSTQNVRRFLMAQCGLNFRFDREFMAWIKDGSPKTLGDVAQECTRRHTVKTSGRSGD